MVRCHFHERRNIPPGRCVPRHPVLHQQPLSRQPPGLWPSLNSLKRAELFRWCSADYCVRLVTRTRRHSGTLLRRVVAWRSCRQSVATRPSHAGAVHRLRILTLHVLEPHVLTLHILTPRVLISQVLTLHVLTPHVFTLHALRVHSLRSQPSSSRPHASRPHVLTPHVLTLRVPTSSRLASTHHVLRHVGLTREVWGMNVTSKILKSMIAS